MKNIIKIAALTTIGSSLVFASGWRLPESSSKSTALSGAYIAASNGADATYYNPANMSFNKNIHQMEIGLMNVNLPSMKYTDNRSETLSGETKEENTLIPSLFLTSKDYGNGLRYGFSITIPGGLTRRWDTPYQKAYAQEFSLRIIELNPTVAYKISDNLSVGGGLRAIYSDGVVKSDGTDAGKPAIRDMEGKTIEYGYNLALAYKHTDTSNLSLTYRSNIDLNEDGNAKLYVSGTKVYDGGASVTVPLPAVLSLAYSFKFGDTNIELEVDRTYWSSYENLDFQYDSSIAAALVSSFDDPKPRDWKDTDAYRIGITHQCTEKFTAMVGYSIDGNAIPENAVSFESPDYNSNTYSFGFDYALSDSSSFGFGYLYSSKDDREVTNTNPDGTTYIDGTLSDAKAHLVSLAYRVDF